MKHSASTDPSGLDSLSKRERGVVDLAVSGKTDEQIAQTLGISTSTVNSYWVRIRGKVGQLSRTEIVGNLLRQEAAEHQAELEDENVRMGEGNSALWTKLAQAHSAAKALRGVAWHLFALDCLPTAVIVTSDDGTVEYANAKAHEYFHAEPGELEGLSMGELTKGPGADAWRASTKPLAQDECAEPIVRGLGAPFYAMRRDGTNFRAVYQAERFVATAGPMWVASIRPFLEDVEAAVHALRQPLEAA